MNLRTMEYKEIKSNLIEIKGVGNKVADCVALFSLDCSDSVPIDTHVYQIY
jgi:N-glycosylase/DNA lyase